MGKYIGIIEQKSYNSDIFFNFRPIAEIKENRTVHQLSPIEQEALLPMSERRNICFSFNWNSDDDFKRMDERFPDGSLVVFEFTLTDLQPAYNSSGNRKSTGYKTATLEMLDSGKIRSLDSEGIYLAVSIDDILTDFNNDVIVEIEPPFVAYGNQVLIERQGFWAGPYDVGYRESGNDPFYYVRPKIKDHKYTVSGYKSYNLKPIDLFYYDYYGSIRVQWQLLSVKQNTVPEQFDVISDSVLIESLKDSIENGLSSNGLVRIDDLSTLLQQYEQSTLSGSMLTEEIRTARLNRIYDIISSEKEVDRTLRKITDFVCELLVKYQDSPNVSEWLQSLVEKHPKLLNQFRNSQAMSQYITDLEDKIELLTSQRGKLEQEISESRQQASSLDQKALEAKTQHMLQQEKEYEELLARIEAGKKLVDGIDKIAELQKKQDNLKQEVGSLNEHKNHLVREVDSLEHQFLELLGKQHEKMINVAFDGFMASKMLHAAAEWENEKAKNQYQALTDRIAALVVTDKSPEELISYLCQMVQLKRPNFSRNTIINIVICLTQGFLTVFSGEPGCGKTSICNILGEALGLNKVSSLVEAEGDNQDSCGRYVSVSVERGWTSKRDFVGYYNPLSKTFDKSNRRIYDALYQLDSEKRANIKKLPYVILLDEANLSPMEYYWSDFMNICDDMGPHSDVNLGENYVFGIPETLHFVATINNDHTTETLSPRLIDRAWIITLPQMSLKDYASLSGDTSLPAEKIDIVSWESLKKAFIPAPGTESFSPEIQKCYDAVVAKLREKKFMVSPRVDLAVKRYWVVASRYFEMDDTETDAATIALDYAIAQRILPKINGNGEDFENWLKEFCSLCSQNGLNTSTDILRDIIDRGNQQMKYYQFFG